MFHGIRLFNYFSGLHNHFNRNSVTGCLTYSDYPTPVKFINNRVEKHLALNNLNPKESARKQWREFSWRENTGAL